MITTAHAQDAELLEGLKRSDNRSIDAIYAGCFNQVRIMVMKNNGSADDAQDVFQEAMVALYRRLHKDDFELTCKLSSYLHVVSRNLWKMQLRKRRGTKSLEDEVTEVVDLDGFVEEQIEMAERYQLLYKYFDRLSDDCRKILELFFKKVTMAQIAQQVGSTEGYIKKRKFICKKRLVDAVKADPAYEELING